MNLEAFFNELLPGAWNQRLLALSDTEQENLRSVAFALAFHVEGEGGGSFHLEVSEGRMRCGARGGSEPLLQLAMGAADFAALTQDLGSEPLALLKGFGSSSRGLTPARHAALAAIRGAIRVQITGARPFAVLVQCGPGPLARQAQTTISLPEQAYSELRAGALDLQRAFLAGKLRVEGDLDLALRMAMAWMAP